jgi:phenylalanyl-tRNA synthetase alpha chain
MSDLAALEQRALAELQACADEASLRAWNSRYFGEQGEVKQALRRLASLPKEERPAYGQAVNRLKQVLQEAYDQARAQHKQRVHQASLRTPALDVTLPGRPQLPGRLHLATQVVRQICAIFADLGFQIYRSREVEEDEFNFGLLNMPEDHPARDLWDTFHTTQPGVLLRTHTSPGQIHVMRALCPEPVRVILPGMCYRYETITPRSDIQFQQIEGLAIGEHITLADLKGTLLTFVQRLFGSGRPVRLRASYFPFTEPSLELDVGCLVCAGQGCSLCKHTGWLEILGAGMVHPVVLRHGGYDPERVSGFAFGLGPQRIAMLLYGIDDIRLFWANDLRFLEQF